MDFLGNHCFINADYSESYSIYLSALLRNVQIPPKLLYPTNEKSTMRHLAHHFSILWVLLSHKNTENIAFEKTKRVEALSATRLLKMVSSQQRTGTTSICPLGSTPLLKNGCVFQCHCRQARKCNITLATACPLFYRKSNNKQAEIK